MTTHAETEIKLLAAAPIDAALVAQRLRDAGVAADAEPTRRIVDAYLDDDEGSLAQAGVGLRLRRTGDSATLGSKRGAAGADGLFAREECEAPWPHEAAPARAAELPPELRARIEPFTLDRPLAVRLVLTTQRDAFTLRADGRSPGVLCVDAVAAAAAAREVRFHEIEIELTTPADLDACRAVATALQEALPLQPAAADKPTHARQLLTPSAPAAAPAAPTPADGLAAVVAARIAGELAALRAGEATVRAERTPEALHALRVVLRRLRSLVRAFRDLWREADADAALAVLAEASRRCGEVRDLDVGAEALRAEAEPLPAPLTAGGAAAVAWAEAERTAATARLHAWFGDVERLAQQRSCSTALAAMDPGAPAAALPAGAEIARRLAVAAARLHKRVDAIADELPTPAVHELRIAGKRLRYLAEAFADGFVDLPKRAQARLVRLQQAIGVVCDHENAVARLCGWLQPAAAASDDATATAAAIGALVARHQAAAAKARKAARRALRRLDRKRFWRAFGGRDEAADANLSG